MQTVQLQYNTILYSLLDIPTVQIGFLMEIHVLIFTTCLLYEIGDIFDN